MVEDTVTIVKVETEHNNDDYNLTYTMSNDDRYSVSVYVNKNGVQNDPWQLSIDDGKTFAPAPRDKFGTYVMPKVLEDLDEDLEKEIWAHFPY